MKNCFFSNNKARIDGGSMLLYFTYNVKIIDSLFEKNSASNGAAIYIYLTNNISIHNTLF